MPPKTAVPSAWRLAVPAPSRDHQRQDAEDEGERSHQDRPEAQPGRLDRPLRVMLRPAFRSSRANSTIKIAFLLARAMISTMPIWV